MKLMELEHETEVATRTFSEVHTSRLSFAAPSVLTYVSVAILSFCGLLFELLQTRVLSYIFWNHLVYLTISVALLGFGVSGAIAPWYLKARQGTLARRVSELTLGTAIAILMSCLVVKYASSIALPVFLRLFLCYAASVPPFIGIGLCLSSLFAFSGQSSGRLYRADLVAAATGCLLFFVMLPAIGAMAGIAVVAVLLILVSLAWAVMGEGTSAAGRLASGTMLSIGAVVLSLLISNPVAIDFTPELYKEMGTMLRGGAQIERTQWTSLARIDVVNGSRGQLLNYTIHPEGSYKIITQDGSAHTRLVGKRAIEAVNALVADGKPVHPSMIPYAIVNRPDVAIIGSGGGIDVVHALAHNPRSVLAIEINPYTYSLTKDVYADFNGHLMTDPRVTAINAEGRNAIRKTDRKFDLLQVIAIDTFAALNSGAYVLSENYLYTVEAFQDYFSHLKPGGMLTMYRWNSAPPREALRLVSLAAEAWHRQGIWQIRDRMVVLGDENWALVMMKNGIFTPAEIEAIKNECAKLHQDLLYAPTGETGQQARAGETPFGQLIHAYDQGREHQFFANYPYKVSATTDNSPFFFETSSIFDYKYWSVNSLRGGGVQSTLLAIVMLSSVTMFGAIFIPLRLFQRDGLSIEGSAAWSIYFAALGLGFMMIEIALMQKCVLLLGNPMHSIPIVLTSLLLAAGLGSGVSHRWQDGFFARVATISGMVFAYTVLLIVMFPRLAAAALPGSMALRSLACILVTFPMGFLLGFYFPTGLEMVRLRGPAFIPWAWGINGIASVFGSVLAIIAAMYLGFNFTLCLGLAAYGTASIAALALTRKQGSAVPSIREDATIPALMHS